MTNIEYLDLVKYLWYSTSLAVFLVWLCRGGWKFKTLESILFKPEKDEPKPESKVQSEKAKAEPEPLEIPPDSPRMPRPGFELFDVFLVIILYLILDMLLIQLVGKDPKAVQDRPIRYFGGLFGKQLLISGCIILIVWRRYVGGLTQFGLRNGGAGRTLMRAAGFSFAAMGMTLLILEVTVIICFACNIQQIQRHYILELLANNPSLRDKLLMSLTAAVGAPLQEELIFRGVLQTYFISLIFQVQKWGETKSIVEGDLPRRLLWSRWLGILIAGGFFALMHLPNWQHVPALFVLGMYLGYFYERYGNLLIPIFVHSMFNILPLAYMMWQVGPRNP